MAFDMSVFPAPAGINRIISVAGVSIRCVPRASGDKPPAYAIYDVIEQCSPRQQG
ncbi:hypothetical protein JHH54_001126 [Salmonella enterica]|nr:hypothetical protein [Salmonella enterica]EGC3743000.1 hypothetical protein [Salmonella enterica]EGJ8080878.1 hypothetical protein [Salmonella enterica]EGX9460318.1 hypothetical protein [Salmonella enterica]